MKRRGSLSPRRPSRNSAIPSQLKYDLSCLGICLVTGGCGYFGGRLVHWLVRNSVPFVHVFDVRPPSQPYKNYVKNKLRIFYGDIRDLGSVMKAMAGVQTVFHIASYGMSGKEMLKKDLIYGVNVIGTSNILQAMEECGAKRIVYTSTFNTVFCGKPLVNEENPPVAPLESHCDNYSRTKAMAEELVLERSRIPPNQRPMIRTCALRSAGIYGDGEERHFPRIISTMEKGRFLFTIGSSEELVEWVYVDNLVHAHILAALKLLDPNSHVNGRAYFISDQKPINNFEFLRPLTTALGYSFPQLSVPVWLLYYFAWLVELCHQAIDPIYAFSPFLTRAEVYKCGVTHYFNPRRSQDELGYFPIVSPEEGMRRMVEYFVVQRANKQNSASSSSWTLLLVLVLCLLLLFLLLR